MSIIQVNVNLKSSHRHHTDKPEADCNRQTPQTTLHHVYVLNLASVRFPMQDQQPGILYLPIYKKFKSLQPSGED